MSILSLVIQPRAKFIQSMLLQVILTCIAAAVTLLACYCCVQARLNSTASSDTGNGNAQTSGLASKGAPTVEYNSSASAVAGVWLFAEIYAISVLRASMPQYTIPSIMLAVFANVSMAYAPQFGTMAQAEQFVKSLLQAYLTGFGIATGVSLLIFPMTSRHLVFEDSRKLISGFRSALGANLTYLTSLEDSDMFAAQRTRTDGDKPKRSPEAEDFVNKVQALSAIQGKFAVDLPFAKREIAIGKLGPDDLQELFRRLRECMIPAIGLTCMSDIFERQSEERGWDRSVSFANVSLVDAADEEDQARIQAMNEWHELIKILKEPFSSITDTIDEGFEHVLLTLQLKKPDQPATKSDDRESVGNLPRAGDVDFAQAYRTRIEEFQDSKKLMLRGWCHIHGIELPGDFFSHASTEDFEIPKWLNTGTFSEDRKRLRRQLMVLLYIEFLLYLMSRRVYNVIKFSDEMRKSGKLDSKRLVVPGIKRIRKWMHTSLLMHQDSHDEDVMDFNDSPKAIHLGEAYQKKKDPEHLAPQTPWERFSDIFRKMPHFFDSPASRFGFRVAVAVMSLAIINCLEDTQVFFTEQRLFWAQIMTSIGMTPSSGQSLRTFILRVLGTIIAMVLAMIAYYVVNGHPAGVLVFFFVFLHFGNYIVLSRQRLIPVGMISQVTITLIVGYQLQVRKIGIQEATSNGQAYYPLWQLSLIRLATVMGGLFLAYFFSIFPAPITEHSQLRKNVGASLYLAANYYSIVHETVQVRLAGLEGDMELKNSPGRRLEKMRQKVFSNCQTILAGLRNQATFVKYDIPIGGKFPLDLYNNIIADLQNVLNYISLISVASTGFTELHSHVEDASGHEWLQNFQKVIGDAKLTSQSVTTLLSLLSSSVISGNPLPPYIRLPEPYLLSERLDQIDTDILSVRHIAEPGYASFAVIQIGTRSLVDDLEKLLQSVKELVGVLDFKYHVVRTTEPSRANSQDALAFDDGAVRSRGKGS